MSTINPADHVRLARWLAERFIERNPGCVRHREDVHSEAFLGLMRAHRAFDPARGFKFSTYATTTIRNWLFEWWISQGHVDRLPRSAFLRGRQRNRVVSLATARAQSFVEELAAVTDTSEADHREACAAVRPLMEQLEGVERIVVEAYYFEGVTLRDLAARIGRSKERVRQIRERALLRMRQSHETAPPQAFQSLNPG